MSEVIKLRGVRVHNLKNIDLDIPVNALTVVTGPSGSGKSSLAFDTLYAEGRRRFVQSMSAYVRQFLERIERPRADLIESIFPAIAIQQKNSITDSRSTVGTITEIFDYLRLLFARVGTVRCPKCHRKVGSDTIEDVISAVEKLEAGKRVWVCFRPVSPVEPTLLRKKGFIRIVEFGRPGAEQRLDDIEGRIDGTSAVVVDRIKSGGRSRSRVAEAAEAAFHEGQGKLSLRIEDQWLEFDRDFRCSSCGDRFVKPEPRLFSFNNPFGACPRCRGFGDTVDINLEAIIPDTTKSLLGGAIEPWRKSTRRREFKRMIEFAEAQGVPTNVPWKALTVEQKQLVVSGHKRYKGIRGFFARLEKKKYKLYIRVFLSRYRGYTRCPECEGSRLRLEARLVRIGKKNIGDVAGMPLAKAAEWINNLKLSAHDEKVVERVLDELRNRLGLLTHIGVGYLAIDRRARTLSGGEVQRINLASALGGGLIGTLFVLDEPTIGLHARDTDRLIHILHSIRDIGNTLVVVEHDARIMRTADNIVDLGPGAGRNGGEVIFSGGYNDLLKEKRSLTAKFLSGKISIPLPPRRRQRREEKLLLVGASEHNLKKIDVEIPLNLFCCITGVSGSGKSTLVHDVLYANIMASRGEWKKKIGKVENIFGLHLLRKVEMVDQSPIGRTPRSNPITYIKAYTEIRQIFADRYTARTRGYKPGHFSFNVRGGRCETCSGNGQIDIEMQFLPDVSIVCEDCNGTRFRREILDIRYKGLNIHEVLQLSVSEAIELFRDFPSLCRKLSILEDVGLGYLQLGQPATTLSGGEGQRIKLAYHMSRVDVSGTLFIFDEPTTGLHFTDIKKLLESFRRLVFHGASVLVIEHNMDVIKNADWIIDLGPEGGDKGGWVVATGTPEQIAQSKGSYTGLYLSKVLETADG